MKNNINKRSLIFPIICVIGMLIQLLPSTVEHDAAFIIAEVCLCLPLLSVLFLKTDISGLLKYQIIFTVITVITYGWYALLIFTPLVLVSIIGIGIVAQSVTITACAAVYAVRVSRSEGSRLLKWLTVLLSTPTIYISANMITDCVRFLTAGISGLAFIG
ncbi:MAG: hypothetical protein K5876_03570 [Ruminiclostridium sp.]|nr:hypothetical protein [Ruminiclostridium sp.]